MKILLVDNIDAWNMIVRRGEGYIYNDFGTHFPGDSPTWNTRDFNKLHRASCYSVKMMTHVTETEFTKHFFVTKTGALNWLQSNRKEQGYTFCKNCRP